MIVNILRNGCHSNSVPFRQVQRPASSPNAVNGAFVSSSQVPQKEYFFSFSGRAPSSRLRSLQAYHAQRHLKHFVQITLMPGYPNDRNASEVGLFELRSLEDQSNDRVGAFQPGLYLVQIVNRPRCPYSSATRV